MSAPRAAAPQLVLVHGLWFGAWSLGLLARRLARQGYAVRRFRYRTTRAGLDQHAAALRQFVGTPDAPQLHFVAHSLGGLVTLRMLAAGGQLPPGRVVLLGSPLNGSTVARRAGNWPGGKHLFGAVRPALAEGCLDMPPDRPTGAIAGQRGFGLGQLAGGYEGPGDGTVALSETLAPGLAAHLVLPVTHTGMLFSREVARQAGAFLRSGRFDEGP